MTGLVAAKITCERCGADLLISGATPTTFTAWVNGRWRVIVNPCSNPKCSRNPDRILTGHAVLTGTAVAAGPGSKIASDGP
jgi:hypothetical protein